MVYEGVSTVWVKFQSVKVGDLGDGGGRVGNVMVFVEQLLFLLDGVDVVEDLK